MLPPLPARAPAPASCFLLPADASSSCAGASLQAEPTAAYIAEVHAAYVREVRRIFDTYKARFGYTEAETLELVSAKLTKAA